MSSSNVNMLCGHCKRPALFPCRVCLDSPVFEGDLPVAWYCSNRCAKANLASHNRNCSRLVDLRTVARVLNTAQKLWYVYREVIWKDFEIQRVERSGDFPTKKLFLWLDRKRDTEWPQDKLKFPWRLFLNREERKSAFAYSGCIQAVIWAHDFLGLLPQGVVTSAEPVFHYPKDSPLQINEFDLSQLTNTIDACVAQNNYPPEDLVHDVLKVTLRSGDIIAVDLSCAQYGLTEVVSKWTTYQKVRIHSFYKAPQAELSPSILQDYSRSVLSDLKDNWLRDCDNETSIMTLFFKKIKMVILRWQRDSNVELRRMWNKDRADFLDEQLMFVETIEENMREPWKIQGPIID